MTTKPRIQLRSKRGLHRFPMTTAKPGKSGGHDGSSHLQLRQKHRHIEWERWQKNVIQFLVLALKIVSAAAIIAIFTIAEYAAVLKVATALTPQPVHADSALEKHCLCGAAACRRNTPAHSDIPKK
jgi:hypothetical protein